jgi:hypothetical protein
MSHLVGLLLSARSDFGGLEILIADSVIQTRQVTPIDNGKIRTKWLPRINTAMTAEDISKMIS